MVTELIRAVNCFTGKQPIKLEILDTEAAVDVDSLALIEFMKINLYEQIFFYHPKNYPYEIRVQLPQWFHTEMLIEGCQCHC